MERTAMKSEWDEATTWEAGWWGNCCNTFGEEYKQLAYAKRMGLKTFHNGKSPFNFDMQGKSVIDIGGGPCSLLLKCVNVKGLVIDPCEYPEWIKKRYEVAKIAYFKIKGEELSDFPNTAVDEAWIYNCLQHTEDPNRIIQNVRTVAKVVRLFEWIDTGVADGHLHNLTESWLNEMLGGTGKTEHINENTAVGKCYYGIFKGDRYE